MMGPLLRLSTFLDMPSPKMNPGRESLLPGTRDEALAVQWETYPPAPARATGWPNVTIAITQRSSSGTPALRNS